MPVTVIREIVEARITVATVEIFHKGQRIASHAVSRVRNRHTTTPEHMPSASSLRRVDAGQDDERAVRIGPATGRIFRGDYEAKPPPSTATSCLGMISLVRSYSPVRVEVTISASPLTAWSLRS